MLNSRAKAPHARNLCHDGSPLGNVVNGIAKLRVRLERQDLGIDAKTADAMAGTEFQCGHQGVGIGQAQAAQFRQGVRAVQARDRCRGRGDKPDRLFPKDTTKAETQHLINSTRVSRPLYVFFSQSHDQINDNADVEKEERESQGGRFAGRSRRSRTGQRAGGDHNEIARPGLLENQADSLERMQNGVKERASLDGTKAGWIKPVSSEITVWIRWFCGSRPR